MNATELLTGPLAQAIGWALLHLLWQATIVAAILAAVLALLPRESANARYAASCGALAFVFVLFVATAVRMYDPAVAPIEVSAARGAVETVRVPLSELPALIAATAAAGWRERAVDAFTTARQSLPSIVALWLAGVVILSIRLLVSWTRARRLVRHGTRAAATQWQRVAARLSEALGLRRAVTLLESSAVEVPSVLGWLRPVILLPASTLTGLTPQQLEMVLAHELAHIRRHDFFVNLLQAVVETLMFYHPAVWWMSARVRTERENCCDDLALAVCGDPLQYARALTRLEELRAAAAPIALAANGGSLIDRIRRIAEGRAESTGASPRWAAAVAMLSILAVALAIPSVPALAQRDTHDSQPSRSKVDVVESAADPGADSGRAYAVDIDPPDVDIDIDPPDIDVDIDPLDFDFEMPEIDVDPDVHVNAPRIEVNVPHVGPRFAALQSVPPPPDAPPAPHAPPPAAPPAPPSPSIAFADIENDERPRRSRTRRGSRPISDSGRLTVDELIQLSAVGVTPAYIESIRAIFPDATLNAVTGLRAVGVTAKYVDEMRAVGLPVTRAQDAMSLHAVGVTPEYVREMRAAGFDIRGTNEITGLRAVGVTADYVRGMRAAGFEVRSAKDATSLHAVGVTPEYVREMRDAGVAIRTAGEATSLYAVGVRPDFVRRLASAGYTNLSIRELTSLAAAGVDDDFIRDLAKYRNQN